MFARLYQGKRSDEPDFYREFQDSDTLPPWVILSYPPTLLFELEPRDFLHPYKAMIRREAVYAIGAYIRFGDLFFDETEYAIPFADANALGEARYDTSVLSRTGMLLGYEGKANLSAPLSRTQAAALLYRFARWETLTRTVR